jgi:SAM-dependent methyltransferase
MATSTAPQLDYDLLAADYARNRGVHPGVLRELIEKHPLGPGSAVLDVGCGTGNYAAALTTATGWRMSGLEPSAEMLARARGATSWDALVQGSAEQLPFTDRAFDLVLSTDVVHHIGNRDAFFREAARVLRSGGHLVTVTDSAEDITRRRPLSSHFQETVEIELHRYPPVPVLRDEMQRAGFDQVSESSVLQEYELTDLRAYRERAFSSLLLIDDDAHQRGMARLVAELERGPIPCVSLYTIVWGTLPRA